MNQRAMITKRVRACWLALARTHKAIKARGFVRACMYKHQPHYRLSHKAMRKLRCFPIVNLDLLCTRTSAGKPLHYYGYMYT